MASVEQINSIIEQFENRLAGRFDGIEQEVKKYNNGVLKILIKQEKLERENRSLREDVEMLKNEVEFLHNKEREKNVVLFKVQDNKLANKDLTKTVKDALERAEVNLPNEAIKEVSRLGKSEGSRQS